eukprot:COSAG06_NODE_1514_length_9226_cov_155.558782_1_plen_31_part_10
MNDKHVRERLPLSALQVRALIVLHVPVPLCE